MAWSLETTQEVVGNTLEKIGREWLPKQNLTGSTSEKKWTNGTTSN
jgi:hypothetical protein